MSEQNLPEDGLEVVDENDVLLDETPGSAASQELDPVHGEPDNYPGAAENNPDRWQEDPMLQEEAAPGGEQDFLSDQALRDESAEARYESGDEQVPPDSPTLGQAAADVDFGEDPTGLEADASDDAENFGGSPLSEFDPNDLER